MQRFAFRSLFPSAVNWRPLLCVAGAAAAAATVYYFSRRRNRQQRSREEAEELTVIEATAPQHEPSVAHQSPLMLPSPSELPSRIPSNLASSSQCAPEAATDAESSQTQPLAPSPPVPLPELQPDQESSSTPKASGDDAASQRESPVPLLEPQPDRESSSSSASEATGDSSPENQPTSPSQAPPVASSTPQPPPEPEADPASSGQSMPEASGGLASPQSRPASRPQAPMLAPSPPQPAPELPSSTQSASGAAADLTVPPEAYQVPALYDYFGVRRSSNFPLRLSALRQAFTLVLSNSHHAKYMSIAGRVLLGGLAARNARDLTTFQEAYARLVAFAQDASHREAICTELAQVGTPGGFLGQLMDMLLCICPVSMQRRPRAEQYLFLLQDQAILLLEDIFGRQEHCYMDPGSLALSLWDCLQTHVRQLLARLQGV